jgi:hypothetical protein
MNEVSVTENCLEGVVFAQWNETRTHWALSMCDLDYLSYCPYDSRMFPCLYVCSPVAKATHLLNIWPVDWMRGSLPLSLYALLTSCTFDETARTIRTRHFNSRIRSKVFHDEGNKAVTHSGQGLGSWQATGSISLPQVLLVTWKWSCQPASFRTPECSQLCCHLLFNRLCDLVIRVPGHRSKGPGFDSRRCQIFWEVMSLERGALSLLWIIVRYLNEK